MDTNSLINVLASDARLAKGPRPGASLAMVAVLALAYCIVAVAAVAGARPDLQAGAGWIALKAGLSLAFAGLALPWAMRLARPGAASGAWPALLVMALAAAGVMTGLALGNAPAGERIAALTAGRFPQCVVVIPVLAIPAAAAMFIWFSRQAPTRPALSGAAAGVIAGGLAAAGYALTCPVDSFAFVGTWYPAAIALCAAAGAAAGSRVLRW